MTQRYCGKKAELANPADVLQPPLISVFGVGDNMIGLYRFDKNLHIVEQGECGCDTALKTFEQCYENSLSSYRSGEEATVATSFGLSKSKEDFIEISCNGKDAVSIHSDRLCYPSLLKKTFGLKHHFSIEGDKDKGMEVIRDYFSLNRHQFEAKHEASLSR